MGASYARVKVACVAKSNYVHPDSVRTEYRKYRTNNLIFRVQLPRSDYEVPELTD